MRTILLLFACSCSVPPEPAPEPEPAPALAPTTQPPVTTPPDPGILPPVPAPPTIQTAQSDAGGDTCVKLTCDEARARNSAYATPCGRIEDGCGGWQDCPYPCTDGTCTEVHPGQTAFCSCVRSKSTSCADKDLVSCWVPGATPAHAGCSQVTQQYYCCTR